MEPQKPSIGRIVHYVESGIGGTSICRAAIITDTGTVSIADADGSNSVVDVLAVDLCVFKPNHLVFNLGVGYNDEKTPGSWHWPERI